MFQSPGLHPPEYPVEDSSVNHPSVHTQDAVAGRSDVPDSIELFPHPRLLQIVLVLSYIKPFLLKKKKKKRLLYSQPHCPWSEIDHLCKTFHFLAGKFKPG